MNTDELARALRHRCRSHQAALDMADALGNPECISRLVVETRARLAEDRDVLAIMEEATCELSL